MTGKLDFVLQFRDEQVAEEVRRKAELGWLDMEFMVYGTAYLKNDQMYYRISSEEKDIYAFIEASLAEHIFCGDVLSLYKRCSVPIGTKEDKEIELAKQLGQQLKNKYPRELFELLQELSEAVQGDESYGWLLQMQEALEGVFEEERLGWFESQLEACYGSQRLSNQHYFEFKQWLKEERRYMLDDAIAKDSCAKTFYGLMAEDATSQAGFRYFEDSLAVYIYKKKFALEAQGRLTSPLFARTYWYHYGQRMGTMKNDYLRAMQQVMDARYWTQLRAVNTAKIISGSGEEALKQMSEEARATYRRYLGRWGVRLR